MDEVNALVKVKFSGEVKDTAFILGSIGDALKYWFRHGPGFISDADAPSGSFTVGVEVSELKVASDDVGESRAATITLDQTRAFHKSADVPDCGSIASSIVTDIVSRLSCLMRNEAKVVYKNGNWTVRF